MGLANIINAVNSIKLPKKYGKVTQVVGLVIRGVGISASIGELCTISTDDKKYIKSEVVGFTKDEILLMPYGSIQGIKSGDRIMSTYKPFTVGVGSELLGRSLNALGEPIDEIETESQGNDFFASPIRYPVHNDPPDPFERAI
jgi:flagellum-specific ATP synthase